MRPHHLVFTVSVLAWGFGCVGLRAEWAVGAYLGTAWTGTSSISLSQPALGTSLRLDPVSYRTEGFNTPPYYGYRLGYFLDRIGFEAEFIHSKALADTGRNTRVEGVIRGEPVNSVAALSNFIERFSISHGLNFLVFNAVVRHRFSPARAPLLNRATLLGRIGLGPTIPHPESTIGGVSREEYELGSLGLHFAAGAEIRIVRGVHALSEYKLTRTNQNVAVPNGHARTRLQSQHLTFGIAYHFE